MVLGWFNKRGRGSPGGSSVATPPAAVPEVTPMPAPVADLQPEPATELPTEPATPPAAMEEIPRDKIAALAYEIWVEKGRPPGTEMQNWLEAETELRIQAERARAAQHQQHQQPIRKPR